LIQRRKTELMVVKKQVQQVQKLQKLNLFNPLMFMTTHRFMGSKMCTKMSQARIRQEIIRESWVRVMKRDQSPQSRWL